MFLTLGLVFTSFGGAFAQDGSQLRLAVPEEMISQGFMRHLLPRFRFRTQIGIDPVVGGNSADMAFVVQGSQGTRIFSMADGQDVFLINMTNDLEDSKKVERFLEWLQSGPGVGAIEGFPPKGPALYSTTGPQAKAEVEEVITGDTVNGARLALVHCGRCHVIDERNRMGGIGSTPSFGALRTRKGWPDLFRVFWTENPHPSFTQVAGVTDPFPAHQPPHIAPVHITLEEIDAILAFVATLEPKDLGQQISSY